jgi:deferrochelatase/peroxidase EfeB
MTHSFVTVAIPFNNTRSDAVEAYLDSLGNPAQASIGAPLDEAQFVHFMSINVIRGNAESKAYIVFEINADTGAESVLDRLEKAIGTQLQTLLETAGVSVGSGTLARFLARYQQSVGQGWFSTPGLNFDGTPDMTVSRIRKEAELAKSIATILDTVPASNYALDTLERVRSKLWADNAMKWAFIAEPAPCLQGKPTWYLALPQILASAFTTLLWPFVLLPLIAFGLVWLYCSLHAGVWAAVLIVAAEIGIAAAAFFALRRKEKTDISEDITPSADIVAEIMKRESFAAQNHLAASSTMKPGFLRRITLRIGFWAAGQIAAHGSRPSFLGDTGVIHFARWILLPGTDKLLFMSNYDGAWESYLEDFIQIAFQGVTGIWSNTVGFPKTEYLFNKGAADGDQLRPWTRRQQYPSRVWYTAYPPLTLNRIRTNAAIRQGLASASTEAEAADWLACFGSSPRPAPTIEYSEVPTLVLGGLRRLRFGKCLFLKLSSNAAKNKAWLKQIEPLISYGDSLSANSAHVVAFSQSGLRKLGLEDRHIATFPVPFQHGSAAPWRARALGDTDANAPEHWKWGNSAHEADAVMLIYAGDPGTLTKIVASRTGEFKKSTHAITYKIDFDPLPDRNDPIKEPFGFVDGISNLSIRGVGRWMLEKNRNQLVEPGEIILGYPDNSGYLPVSPTVASSDDPENILPAPSPDPARLLQEPPPERPDFSMPQPTGQRDLGFNGTFLVVRQLEQDTAGFDAFLDEAAKALKNDPHVPSGQLIPTKAWKTPIQDWIAAKLVGRWKDGTSLVRHPHRPGTVRNEKEKPDNEFLLGAEDPTGLRCPFGAHIRRANPRETFAPGSQLQLSITNRHRIHRIGRSYKPQNGLTKPGLVFMCLNADIERQFEFVQQTWVLGRSFNGLENEVDPIIANKSAPHSFTIPTANGPLRLKGLKDFVKVRGGGYFFLPGKRAIRFLAH